MFVCESSYYLWSSIGASLELYEATTKADMWSFGIYYTLSLPLSEVACEE